VRFRQAQAAGETAAVSLAPRPAGAAADIAVALLGSVGVTVADPTVSDPALATLGLRIGRTELGAAVTVSVRPAGAGDWIQQFGRMAPIGGTVSTELAREILAATRACSARDTAAGLSETHALATLLVDLGHLTASAQLWLEHLSADRLVMGADGTWQASEMEVRLR
jgi:hypothetical protein